MKKIEPCQIGEFITLAMSVILLACVSAYLVWNILDSSSSYVEITASAAQEVSTPAGGRYIMPIEVTNSADKTVNYIKLHIQARFDSGLSEVQEAEVEYLSSHSTQRVYVYFTAPVTRQNIEVTPVYYKFN